MSLSSVEIVVGASNPSLVEVRVSGSNPSIIELQPTGSPAVVQLNIGPAGAGVAAGGVANDILKKTSSTDYATAWETPTSTATANAVVRRDASGGAAFVALTGTGDWSTTGHFLSNPGSATAGHFITKNGTTPTIAVGRSAWFSSTTGTPQFRNGTGSAVTLIYDGGALGTPLTGTLTNCTGLPIATGVSGLAVGVADYLAGGGSQTFLATLNGEYVGAGSVVFSDDAQLLNPQFDGSVSFTSEDFSYGTGSASAHRAALELTALATTIPAANVAAFLATPTSANLAAALTDETGTGAAVFGTSPTITGAILTAMDKNTSGRIAALTMTQSPPCSLFEDFCGASGAGIFTWTSSGTGSDSTGTMGPRSFGVRRMTTGAILNNQRKTILPIPTATIFGMEIRAHFAIPDITTASFTLGIEQSSGAFGRYFLVYSSALNSGNWLLLTGTGAGSSNNFGTTGPANGNFASGKRYRTIMRVIDATTVYVKIDEADWNLDNWTNKHDANLTITSYTPSSDPIALDIRINTLAVATRSFDIDCISVENASITR